MSECTQKEAACCLRLHMVHQSIEYINKLSWNIYVWKVKWWRYLNQKMAKTQQKKSWKRLQRRFLRFCLFLSLSNTHTLSKAEMKLEEESSVYFSLSRKRWINGKLQLILFWVESTFSRLGVVKVFFIAAEGFMIADKPTNFLLISWAAQFFKRGFSWNMPRTARVEITLAVLEYAYEKPFLYLTTKETNASQKVLE
jgi:hypothetical protein